VVLSCPLWVLSSVPIFYEWTRRTDGRDKSGPYSSCNELFHLPLFLLMKNGNIARKHCVSGLSVKFVVMRSTSAIYDSVGKWEKRGPRAVQGEGPRAVASTAPSALARNAQGCGACHRSPSRTDHLTRRRDGVGLHRSERWCGLPLSDFLEKDAR
jgi:hypothetical protein